MGTVKNMVSYSDGSTCWVLQHVKRNISRCIIIQVEEIRLRVFQVIADAIGVHLL